MKEFKFTVPEINFEVKIDDSKPYNKLTVNCKACLGDGGVHLASVGYELSNENISIFEEVTMRMRPMILRLSNEYISKFIKDFAFVESEAEKNMD